VSQRFVKQVSAVGRTQLQEGDADATGPTVDAIHPNSFPIVPLENLEISERMRVTSFII
jgi:hypothetical protein